MNNKPVPPQHQPDHSLVISSAQFDCGPSAPNLPSDSVLKTWTPADLLNAYEQAWQWGDRCSELLAYNQLYFKCFQGDQTSCTDVSILNNTTKTVKW